VQILKMLLPELWEEKYQEYKSRNFEEIGGEKYPYLRKFIINSKPD